METRPKCPRARCEYAYHPTGPHSYQVLPANATKLLPETAKSVLGEGLHTSLRKVGRGPYSLQAYDAIEHMPEEEWDAVLSHLLAGLDTMGIYLVNAQET